MATRTRPPILPVEKRRGVAAADEGTPLLLISVTNDDTAGTTPLPGFPAPKTKTTAARNASYLQQKGEDIELLLSRPEIDLWKLREFALTPGGLVNDTIRKRAWPKLVGLDHNHDPLPLDEIAAERDTGDGSLAAAEDRASPSKPRSPAMPTIEIDAQHELLREREDAESGGFHREIPPSPALIVESMDSAQIDRDVARCTWHLLTGTQRSRRCQHRSITQNSTRGSGHRRHRGTAVAAGQKRGGSHRHNTAKYKRNRKISVLLKKKQHRLANLINLTLAQSYDRSDGRVPGIPGLDRLRYYQGYHDVACIFLHALGGAGTNQSPMARNNGSKLTASSANTYRHYPSGDLELPSKVLCQVSFSHFTDALRSDFLRLQTGLKLVLFPLLRKIDPEVHGHLLDADMEPFFCLSWILTWFAHDVRDTGVVKRLFDAFLVAHPALPVYASLAMMTHPHNKRIILETDCDFAALHQCLASLPRHSCKVGYKERKVEGFDNVLTYVSDDEGEDAAAGDNATINTNTETYLEDEPSEFDDDDSNTFDTWSQYTNETIYTESSFPTSIASSSQVSTAGGSSSVKMGRPLSATGGSLASGSLASLQEHGQLPCPTDRTLISTEDPDFCSKESTLVSGTWNGPWITDTHDQKSTAGAPVGEEENNGSSEKKDGFVMDDNNPVPFEAVLDTALQFMNMYPPSSLVALAKAYYQDDWDSQLSLLATTTTNEQDPINVQELIGLLQPTPPAWSILPSCTSDWIDKQKLRQELGLKPISRKDRRKRKQKKNLLKKKNTDTELYQNTPPGTPERERAIGSGVVGDRSEDTNRPDAASRAIENKEPRDPMEYVRSNPEDRVVAAIGYGPGLEAKKRQRQLLRQQRQLRRRKRALMIGCGVAIGALAMYGGHKLFGSTRDGAEELEPSPPPVSGVFVGSSTEDKWNELEASGATTETKSNGTVSPRVDTVSQQQQNEKLPPTLSLTKAKTLIATSPERTTIVASSSATPKNATLFPSASMVLPVPNPAVPTELHTALPLSIAVPTSGRSAPTLTLANDGDSILNGVVHRTKLFVTRFFNHFWSVCRGFVFRIPFFPRPRSKL